MLRQHDGNITDKGDITNDAPVLSTTISKVFINFFTIVKKKKKKKKPIPNDVLPVQVILPGGIQFSIVSRVIVSLGEELRLGSGPKLPDDSMHDGYVLSLHVVDHNLADAGFFNHVSVPEEQQVASLECRLHASREDDDDGRRGVGDDAEAFPHLFLPNRHARVSKKAQERERERMTRKNSGRASWPKVVQRTMNAVDRMSPKFISCAAACRGLPKLDNILI